jgi:hypothetical protein
MERLHLKPRPETGTGRDYQFCRHSDPNFAMSAVEDRLVISKGVIRPQRT